MKTTLSRCTLLLFFLLPLSPLSAETVIPDGVQKEYYYFGSLHREITFKDGSKNGITMGYFGTGSLINERCPFTRDHLLNCQSLHMAPLQESQQSFCHSIEKFTFKNNS
jgi:hypothetical protein